MIDVGRLTETETVELFEELIVNIAEGWEDNQLFGILQNHLTKLQKEEIADEWGPEPEAEG